MKNSALALILSLIVPGVGQIYNGEVGKGIGFIVGYFVSWLLIFVVIGFLTTPAIWIWGMVDAYKTAEKMNKENGQPKEDA